MDSMSPPPMALYATLEELLIGANNFAVAHGYKLVVVRSKTNAQGQKTWVHLACDRHGTKRNTHNLTPETRKKNRRSRRCECPMFCVASKTQQEMWELSTRHADHNHTPYEPPAPKKKADIAKPHASEVVNLPALQTPSACIADFCLIPIGTASPSVSQHVAEVQRLLKRTNMKHSMHSAGTTLEGSWDDVTRFIGQAHSLLHGSGVMRIHTTISIGSRMDKKQGFQDKVDSVRAILDGFSREEAVIHHDSDGDDNDDSSMREVEASMVDANDPNIQPGLDQHRILSHMHTPMANMGQNIGHALHQQLMAQHPMHQQQQNQQQSHQQQLAQNNHMHQGQLQMTPHQHPMSQQAHPLSQSMNMQ